ncbi:TPA: hypothetical protein F3L22_10320 [Aeromonas hydrophila]|nr:hypothetical protein [Aeromonas hydrophila]
MDNHFLPPCVSLWHGAAIISAEKITVYPWRCPAGEAGRRFVSGGTKKCRCQFFRANQEGLETVYGTVG